MPYGPAVIDAQLEALEATGATVARSDAPWEVSEPRPPADGVHRYDWRFDDLVAGALAIHHLRWMPIIDYSAPWAQSVPGDDHSPPASASDYAAYAAALAGRYGAGGSFWRSHPELAAQPVDTYEIWNEPDSSLFWSPRPDPARYGALYLRARDAIKAVQGDARVIVGGLAHPASFLPALAPVLSGRVDGIGIHPYGATPAAVLANVRAARATLDRLGLASAPLYVTEFGWTPRPAGSLDYAPADLRPGYIRQTLAGLGQLQCNLAAVLLYAWITPERNPEDPNGWFGINPPGGGGSPAVAAFANGLHDATAASHTLSCG